MKMKCSRCGEEELHPQDRMVLIFGELEENKTFEPVCETCGELLREFMEGHDVVTDPRHDKE